MEKPILIIIIAALLLLPLAIAKPFPQYTAVDLRHSVRIDGAVVSNAFCNVTVINPKGIVLTNFKPMGYNSLDQTYNYTLPATNITERGTYNYDITCTSSGENSTESFEFEVNASGKEYTLAQSITYFFLFILAIFFFILTLYGAITMPKDNEKMENSETGEIVTYKITYKKYLKMLFIVLCYGFLIILSYLGWNISYGLLDFLTIGFFFKYVFYILMGLSVPVLVIVFITSFQNLMEDKKLKKEIEYHRGVIENARW